MRCTIQYGKSALEITNDDGRLVVLRNGKPTSYSATYTPDPCCCTILGMLADAAGVWGGPATRRALNELATAMLPADRPARGADYDAVIAEFHRRGAMEAER